MNAQDREFLDAKIGESTAQIKGHIDLICSKMEATYQKKKTVKTYKNRNLSTGFIGLLGSYFLL